MAKPSTPASTQQLLDISRIEQDLVILQNGSVLKILRAFPINFDLKSEQEQNAIIFSFQSFINSLSFPIQIVIRSRKLDLERYLMKLESQTKNITNNLLQIQAQDYIGFVRRLVQIANIMSKQFYVVINYQQVLKSGNPISNFIPSNKAVRLTEDQITTFKEQVETRTGTVMAGLGSVGIKTEVLDTQQLIETFYNIYNPEESMTERLAPASELEADMITTGNELAGIQPEQNPPNNQPAAEPLSNTTSDIQ